MSRDIYGWEMLSRRARVMIPSGSRRSWLRPWKRVTIWQAVFGGQITLIEHKDNETLLTLRDVKAIRLERILPEKDHPDAEDRTVTENLGTIDGLPFGRTTRIPR